VLRLPSACTDPTKIENLVLDQARLALELSRPRNLAVAFNF
jgi:hypothetical protein